MPGRSPKKAGKAKTKLDILAISKHFFLSFFFLKEVLPPFIHLRQQKATPFPVLLSPPSRSPLTPGGLALICCQGCCIRAQKPGLNAPLPEQGLRFGTCPWHEGPCGCHRCRSGEGGSAAPPGVAKGGAPGGGSCWDGPAPSHHSRGQRGAPAAPDAPTPAAAVPPRLSAPVLPREARRAARGHGMHPPAAPARSAGRAGEGKGESSRRWGLLGVVRPCAPTQQTPVSMPHMSSATPPWLRPPGKEPPRAPHCSLHQGEGGRCGSVSWVRFCSRRRGWRECCPMGHGLDRDREWQQGGEGTGGDWRGRSSFPQPSYHSMLRDLGRKADSSAEAYSAFRLFSCFCLTDKRWANLARLLSDLGKGRGEALMSLKHPGPQWQVHGTKPGDARS